MKKGIIGLMTACMLFNLAVIGDGQKVEAAVSGDGNWTLVTDVTSLEAGDTIVIAAKDSNHALGTTQNSNNRAAVTISKSNDNNNITIDNSVQQIALEPGIVENTFAFNVDNGYLYAASSSKNYLRTQTTNNGNGSWKIEINEGNATIKAQGSNTRNWLKKNSSDALFSCYGSGQSDVCIYEWIPAQSGDGEEAEPEVADVSELNSLIGTYYNLGEYIKDTEIYLNETAITEQTVVFDELFHNKVTDLERRTYFTKDDLWMTNDNNVNSGYGTADNGDMNHFYYYNGKKVIDYTVKKGTQNWANPEENGMEGYYLTLKDFVATDSQNWTVLNNVFSSEDENVINLFKAICAPCYKGFTLDSSNYIDLEHVEVEEKDGSLELRLYAAQGEYAKLTNHDNNSSTPDVFAKAIISDYVAPENPGEVIVESTKFVLSGHTLDSNAAVITENTIITDNFKNTSDHNYDLSDYVTITMVNKHNGGGFGFYGEYRIYKTAEISLEAKTGYVITEIGFESVTAGGFTVGNTTIDSDINLSVDTNKITITGGTGTAKVGTITITVAPSK